MAVALNALISRAEALAHLDEAEADISATQLTHLDLLIDAATQIIETATSRKFKYDSGNDLGTYNATDDPDDSIYDGLGGPRIYLRQFPIVAVNTIEVVTDVVNQVYSVDTVNADDYAIKADRGIIELRSSRLINNIWPEGPQNVRVNYEAGYAAIPNDLKMAALELVKSLWLSKERDPDLVRETLGDASFWYTGGSSGSKKQLPLLTQLAIEKYRRPPL